ncbi:CHAT domain-containing protein [Sphaerisporangium sp. NPDC088356]|uniref:CHAT domain-containing protein n=1 Tax=Sphaerisporangium sp. NPDC088356 TaxID=3154871 RepID=UPI0034203B0A
MVRLSIDLGRDWRAKRSAQQGHDAMGRYHRTGRIGDLDQAIESFTRACDVVHPDSSSHAEHTFNLAVCLSHRYERSADEADLRRALKLLDEAATGAGTRWHLIVSCLDAKGSALLTRYQSSGHGNDLQDALEAYAQATELISGPSVGHLDRLANYGNALHERYRRSGGVTDLRRAIESQTSVLTMLRPDHPHRALHQAALGLLRHENFGRTGDLSDLEAAMDAFVAAHPIDDSPDRAQVYRHLGRVLLTVHQYTDRPDDLSGAVEALQRGFLLAPAERPADPQALVDLGSGLCATYEITGDREQLAAAIDLLRQAHQVVPPKSPGRFAVLSNLAAALASESERTGDRSGLDEGIELQRHVVAELPPDAPATAAMLCALGRFLALRSLLTGRGDDAEEAARILSAACGRAVDDPAGLLSASDALARLLADQSRWPEAADFSAQALRAFRELLVRQRLRGHKEIWLRRLHGVADRAAVAAAECGRHAAAVELLEQGRGMLSAHAFERSLIDLDLLRTLGQGELADRWERAAAELTRLEAADVQANRDVLPSAGNVEGLVEARTAFDALAAEIHAMSQAGAILGAGNLADIARAASAAPLLYVAMSDHQAWAFLVHADARVDAVSLPEATGTATRQVLAAYQAAYAGRGSDPASWRDTVDSTTEWLWSAVFAPVRAQLTTADALTVVQSGLIGALPLHAAWMPASGTPTKRRYALDDLLISYAPSARALLHAQRAVAGPIPPGLLLAYDSSLNAELEVAAARRAFPDAMVRRDCSRRIALENLGSHGHLHFACHGRADPDRPLDGGLLMKDQEYLTLRDVLTRRLRVRLAVLSGCETARTDLAMPEETVSLPALFLQAGAGGVIGSMWAVDDPTTALLMARFHRLRQSGAHHPAAAFREAQRWVRDATNDEKTAEFPEATQEARDRITAEDLDIWGRGRSTKHPQSWASFQYVGC